MEVLIVISTVMGLAECVLFCYVATMSDLKFSLYVSQCEIYCENGKKMFLAADLGHISRAQSRGPGQRLWLSNIPGRAKSRLRPKVRPGFFWPGLARLLASGRNRHITTSTLLSFRRKKIEIWLRTEKPK